MASSKHTLTLAELETALAWADADFRMHYARHWNWQDQNHNWHLQVRAECKEYGRKALELFSQNKIKEALDEIKYAHALEGDFCGWVDTRVYGHVCKLLHTM